MDWEILLKYLPMYEKAAWLTIQIGFMGIAGATVLGLICAVIQYERIPFLRQITAMYIELSRNTPLLVQLFFINDQDDKSDIDGRRLGFRRIRRFAELQVLLFWEAAIWRKRFEVVWNRLRTFR